MFGRFTDWVRRKLFDAVAVGYRGKVACGDSFTLTSVRAAQHVEIGLASPAGCAFSFTLKFASGRSETLSMVGAATFCDVQEITFDCRPGAAGGTCDWTIHGTPLICPD